MTNQELLQATMLALTGQNVSGGMPLMPTVGDFTTSTYTPAVVQAAPIRALSVKLPTIYNVSIVEEEE